MMREGRKISQKAGNIVILEAKEKLYNNVEICQNVIYRHAGKRGEVNVMKKPKWEPFSDAKKIALLSCLLLLETFLFIYCIIYWNISIDDWIQTLSSVPISVLCSFIAALVFPKIVREKDYQSLLADIEKKIKELPLATYEDTDKPHKEFNEKMNDSISMTRNYFYFGDRAFFLTKRLGDGVAKDNHRIKITVFLADVRKKSLFSAREEMYQNHEKALRRKKRNKLKTKSKSDLINDARLDVLQSLYALGKLREDYNIDVYLHKEIPFIRFEITDDLICLSFLPQLSSGNDYPSTVLYDKSSIFKPNFEDYSQELKRRSHLMKDEDLELENLLKLGKQAKIAGCNEKTITRHYRKNVKV